MRGQAVRPRAAPPPNTTFSGDLRIGDRTEVNDQVLDVGEVQVTN